MPGEWWTPERRRGDRRIVAFPLRAEIAGADAAVTVHELGPGGMVVESPRPLKQGDAIAFALASDRDSTGPMKGHVVHSRLLLAGRHGGPPRCLAGVAFAHVTPAQSARIAEWLAATGEPGASPSRSVP